MPAKESKPAPPTKAASKGVAKAAPKKAAAGKAVAKAAAKVVPAAKAAAKKVVGKVVAKGKAVVGKGKVAGKGKAAPVEEKQTGSKYQVLFHKKPRNFSIGNDIQPRRDLTRYVRWPRYIRIARQKKILQNRLKVPPAIHQFRKTLDKNATESVYKLAKKYKTEEKQAKRARLLKVAAARAKGEVPETLKRPLAITHGANQVIKAIEAKKAKLVLIAHDVDPIELVVAIPALCRKLEIPYAIIKSRSRLGNLARRKFTAAVAITDVRKEDKNELANLAAIARETFNDNIEHRRQWGGGRLGVKSAAVIAKRQRILAKEIAARQKA